MPSPEAEVLKGTADLLALPEGAEALRYVETTVLDVEGGQLCRLVS